MIQVGVIGAGVSASALTFVLDQHGTDAAVTILEKSRGVCGRAATRRRGDVTYDYGANYVTSADDRVTDVLTNDLDTDGLVDVTEPIWTFDRDGTVSEGRTKNEHKWTFRSGLTQLAKRLLEPTDATVHRGTRVERIERSADGWRLTDADGTAWGPFDVLVLNPPAPQTATLLETADWNAPVRDELAAAARAVPYRTVWTAVLGYPFELEVPYYALVNDDKAHEVGWISREECKPGHVPDGESVLVVQANHEWSTDRYDEPAPANVAELAELTASILGDERLTAPDWTDHQGWRYALPEAAVDRGPLVEAETHGLYAVGDWVPGEGRVHAALRNGLETGTRLANRYRL